MNIRVAIKHLVLKPRLVRRIINLYDHYRADCCVISYPKCGRTWLRVMLAKALALHLGDPRDIVFEPKNVIRTVHQSGPHVRFTHDWAVHSTPAAIEQSERWYYRYRHKKVIFLVRDPRDVLVSHYFQLNRRRHREGVPRNLSRFIRHPLYGADKVIVFMKGWCQHRHIPLDFLLVRYEDLHLDAAVELRRVLTFINLSDVSDEVIRASVKYASFNSMREMSLKELKDESIIAPVDPQDPESFKVRSGEVGGYTRYLSIADVKYIEERMRCELPSLLGYTDQEV